MVTNQEFLDCFKKSIKEMKEITVNVHDLINILRGVKRTRNRVTLFLDPNTKTLYIPDQYCTYTLKAC